MTGTVVIRTAILSGVLLLLLPATPGGPGNRLLADPGEITAVNAGRGLTGGGDEGEVILEVAIPLALDAAAPRPVISGRHAPSGNIGELGGPQAGVTGESHSSDGFGVAGVARAGTFAKGVYGYSYQGIGGFFESYSGPALLVAGTSRHITWPPAEHLQIGVWDQPAAAFSEWMRIRGDDGRVGIGTQNPQNKLDVKGGVDASYFRNGNEPDRNTGVFFPNFNRIQFQADGTNSLLVLRATDATLTDNDSGHLVVGDPDAANIVIDNNELMARKNSEPAKLYLNIAGCTGGCEGTGGNVVVGVLEIVGGADLAEPFDMGASGEVRPGMVVAIDPSNPGRLRLADKAYDRTVAGIVSGANGMNPGLTMRQTGTAADGALPISLTGRAYVWADASSGPIEAGDLLTSSDVPGHAMKVTDHMRAHGAIIGKAMGGLDEGRGLILVLVSLH